MIKISNVATDELNGQSYEDILKQVSDAGHQIGSHTYEHKNIDGLSRSEIEEQMNKNSDVIYNAIGKRYVDYYVQWCHNEICHLTSSFTVLDLLVSLDTENKLQIAIWHPNLALFF